ncbi:MAG: DUF1648 domain-containing protein [Chloroflexi bacterium]|nr:DUF1648 domain-containing protein [Chloroflexota bacterium]
MRQRLNKAYPPQLEAAPAVLVFLGLYLAASSYGILPDRIPTHFDFFGTPDGWGGRGQIWVSPAIGAGLYIVLTVIAVASAVVKDPMALINLPARWKKALTAAQAEGMRVFMLRNLLFMKTMMLCLTTYLTRSTIEVALGRQNGLGAPFFFFLAGALVAAGAMAWKALRISSAKPK